MEHKKSKILLAIGFVFAFVMFITAPVFAYDEIPLEFNWIYKKNGDSAIYTWNNGYASNVEGLDMIGMECGFPVPHFAHDGQYSLYFHFKFTCDQNPKPLFRMFISPYDSRLSLYPNTSSDNYLVNQLGSSDLFGELNQYNANLKNYWGTFRWMQNSSCTFNWVCMREKSPDYSNQYTYSVIGIMDLRLMEESEMSPFRLGIEIANAQSYSTYTVYNVDMGLRAMDSSETWALYDLWSRLDEIGIALNSVTQVPWSWYTNTVTSYLSSIMSRLSTLQGTDFDHHLMVIRELIGSQNNELASIYDDGETDPDVTRWSGEAHAIESVVSDYHEMESQMMGTVTDFTFPTAPNQTAMGNVFNMFFGNELVLALILATLTITIAFLILF